MKLQTILLFTLSLYIFSACSGKPDHHPKNPNYKITKPRVKYTPSKQNLAKMVKELQGSPYVWAEEGPDNFDCSGFTYYLYGSMGINIPRVARHQAKVGKRVSVKNLQYGDLIFFATSKRSSRKITHVGMYLGDGWFTHASTIKHEVIYSNLFTSSYYKRKLRICRRYLPDASQRLHKNETVIKSKRITKVLHNNVPTGKKELTERKAIVIKAPTKDISQASTQDRYYVQVGSFIGYPKKKLLNHITHNGFTYKIIQFPREGKNISKLLIGPYSTKKVATTALSKVRLNIQHDAFIAEIR